MSFANRRPVLDFTHYANDRSRDFNGREWVYHAIDTWLAEPNASRYFLLTGDPGSGKTAIAARLYQFSIGMVPPPKKIVRFDPGFLAAAHFCSARDGSWIDPRTFARSIASQLATFQEYAQALKDVGDNASNINAQVTAGAVQDTASVAAVIINNLVLAGLNAQDAFNRSVLDPLLSIYGSGFDKPVTILVDVLDESLLHQGDVTIVELLSRLENLSPRVRFILTSRHDLRVENKLREAAGLFLSAAEHENDNHKDIGGYVKARLRKDKN